MFFTPLNFRKRVAINTEEYYEIEDQNIRRKQKLVENIFKRIKRNKEVKNRNDLLRIALGSIALLCFLMGLTILWLARG